jgi:hypothetical protein
MRENVMLGVYACLGGARQGEEERGRGNGGI